MGFDIPHDQLSRLKQLEDNNNVQQKETTDTPFIKVFEIVEGKVKNTKVVPKT
jgi:hypothetical protein